MSDASGFPLEAPCRLSQSVLWRLQRRFFERRGVAAWSEGVVPHHVTTSAFLARAYSRVAEGFARDWAGRLDPAQPVYIVELGAGSGRLAFHMLRSLAPAGRAGDAQRGRFCYVLSDFAEANLAAWRAHPALAPWLDAGLLDIARFDAEHDAAIALERSGAVLSPGRVANPVIAIANYVFDGLPLDAFSVAGGELHEWRVRLCSARPDADLDDPEILARARLACDQRPVPPGAYYGDAALDGALGRAVEDHRALADAAFTFPTASLACVRRLSALAGGRLLVLSSDKGEPRDAGQTGPAITLHGSFSIAVNYRAVAHFVDDAGGEALVPAERPHAIATCAFVLGPPPGGAAETRRAYADAIDAQRPDDLFAIEQGLEAAYPSLSLAQWIAYLRFTGCDPKLVADALPHLAALAAGATATERAELARVLVQAYDGHLDIGESLDLGFELGVLASALGAWREALALLSSSLACRAPSARGLFRIAVCHAELGEAASARARLDDALALDPRLDPTLDPTVEAVLALRARLALP
jgi:tetratricopeptide (TPR) repeat protein